MVATARPDEAPSASQWEAACGAVLLTGAAPPWSARLRAVVAGDVAPGLFTESHPPVDAAATTATFSQTIKGRRVVVGRQEGPLNFKRAALITAASGVRKIPRGRVCFFWRPGLCRAAAEPAWIAARRRPQAALNIHCERVRATEHAPSDPSVSSSVVAALRKSKYERADDFRR